MKRIAVILVLVHSLLAVDRDLHAQDGDGGPISGVTCPLDSGMGAELATKVCYGCMFPVQIAGEPRDNNVPWLARTSGTTCTCPSIYFGYPTTGPVYGQWLPIRMVETVRMPFCSTIAGNMGGDSSGGSAAMSQRLVGGFVGDEDSGGEKEGYYHFHWFAFPMGVLMDQNISMMCKSNESMDMDMLYMSELDPTWNNDELAITLTPEAPLLANDIALLACLADSVSASVAQPLDILFWCAGAWGEIYPHSGHTPHEGSPPQMHSLIKTRATAGLHRRGLAFQMMGPTAVCANHPNPIMTKSQYKFQTVYPIAEENFNHWIGANTFRWGEHRNIPGKGEDWVSIVWAYEQCCLND